MTAGAAGYVGRFAPSPTGALHFGSLLAAVGSFLDARSRGGQWRVRIEDIDPRCIRGSDTDILRTLEAFALHWDGPVEYQSARTELYRAGLERLRAAGATFECSCSRGELARLGALTARYPGRCREGPRHAGPTATRLRIDEQRAFTFDDRFQGVFTCAPGSLGDVIVRRRDGVFAYQLAVVIDDAAQNITDVVRGADLLESTGWQIALHEALGLAQPRYGHLPLLSEPDGQKLAKRRHAVAIDPQRATEQLLEVLRLLRQSPPGELRDASPAELLDWACAHWRTESFSGLREIPLPQRTA